MELAAQVSYPISENVSAQLLASTAMVVGLALPPVADWVQQLPNGSIWCFVLVAAVFVVRAVVMQKPPMVVRLTTLRS